MSNNPAFAEAPYNAQAAISYSGMASLCGVHLSHLQLEKTHIVRATSHAIRNGFLPFTTENKRGSGEVIALACRLKNASSNPPGQR